MPMKRRVFVVMLVVVSIFLFASASCGGDDSEPSEPGQTQTTETTETQEKTTETTE
jgi:hypothetical protein